MLNEEKFYVCPVERQSGENRSQRHWNKPRRVKQPRKTRSLVSKRTCPKSSSAYRPNSLENHVTKDL